MEAVPFAELREIDFPRIWRDKEPIGQDSNGNDTRPAQEEAPRWLYTDLHDSTGYYNEPLQVYLSAGEHTLTIFSEREPMAVGGVRIYSAPQPAPYAEALESYRPAGFGRRAGILRVTKGSRPIINPPRPFIPFTIAPRLIRCPPAPLKSA